MVVVLVAAAEAEAGAEAELHQEEAEMTVAPARVGQRVPVHDIVTEEGAHTQNARIGAVCLVVRRMLALCR